MPKPTVTTNLKRLEAAGLLRRQIDPTDLRRHRLLLTPDGRKTMSRGLALLSDAFGARLGRLSAAQRHQIAPQVATAVDLDEAGQGHGGSRAAYAAARSSSVGCGCRLCR